MLSEYESPGSSTIGRHGVQATYTDPFNAAFNATSNQPQYEGQLTETHIFSPNVVNNFIASGSWYSAMFVMPHAAQAKALFPFAIQSFDAPFGNNTLDLVMVARFPLQRD